MTIWKDTLKALNLELDIPNEFKHFLGIRTNLALFRVDDSRLREVYRCTPKKEQIGYQPVTGFQDAYPLHLLNLASVRDVESQMSIARGDITRLSATRFRANLIIICPDAYVEDIWRRIRIGSYEYDISCRTARCKMPNIHPTTGERHQFEPDRTLRSHRAIDEGARPNIGCLGMQMVPISQQGHLKVGDEVIVTEIGKHHYVRQ